MTKVDLNVKDCTLLLANQSAGHNDLMEASNWWHAGLSERWSQ